MIFFVGVQYIYIVIRTENGWQCCLRIVEFLGKWCLSSIAVVVETEGEWCGNSGF